MITKIINVKYNLHEVIKLYLFREMHWSYSIFTKN